MSTSWNSDSDSRPGTSRMERPITARVRESEMVMAEKSKRLPEDFRVTFRRMITELYEQESVSMVNFIEDTRQAIAATYEQLNDEQEVLSLTSRKISIDRQSSARPGTSAGRRLPPPQHQQQEPATKTGRHGAISTRAQRVATAKHGSRQQQQQQQLPSSGDAHPTGAAPLRPTTGRMRMQTSVNSDRPSTPSTSSRRSTPGSSMDSLTFENEMRRQRVVAPSTPPAIGLRLTAPADNLPTTNQSTPQFPVPSTVITVSSVNTDDEYEEEKDEIMKHMSGAHTQIDRERERQKALLRDRQEKKKVKHDQHERTASAMVREASNIEERKLKEKERQEQLIKERLEERKKRKNEATSAMVDESHRQTVVVRVAESNDVVDTTV